MTVWVPMTEPNQEFVENPAAADYARAARIGLERRDWRLAFEQIAAALALEPLFDEYLYILDQSLDSVDDPLGWLDIQVNPFFGFAAVRAWALARLGQVNEALLLLLEVVEARPDIPYLAWTRLWLRDGHAVGKVNWATVGPAFADFFDLVRQRDFALERSIPNLEGALWVLKALRAVGPENASATYLITALLRKLDRGQEALALAEGHFEETRDWVAAVEVANIHRDRGDTSRTIEYLRQADVLAPGQASVLVDLRDALLAKADFERAAEAYEPPPIADEAVLQP